MTPTPSLSLPGQQRLRAALWLAAVVVFLTADGVVLGQPSSEAPSAGGPRYGEPDVIRFRVGAEITADRGACRNILAMVAVPLDCPEQKVEFLDEELSPHVREITYRSLQDGPMQGGVRQMVIAVPFLPAGATARAVVTMKVSTRPILRPERTDDLRIPQRITNELRPFIRPSPYIDVRHRSIVSLAREALEKVDASSSDWKKIESIYHVVLEKVAYVDGKDKSALEALRDGQADCQGRSMLFIAMCRANKIPARMVWVDGHAYPEFYLEDAESRGWWFPSESAGAKAFGEMPLTRTVLQKGDNFRVPERKERLRYASDYMIGIPATRESGTPKCVFIHEELGRE